MSVTAEELSKDLDAKQKEEKARKRLAELARLLSHHQNTVLMFNQLVTLHNTIEGRSKDNLSQIYKNRYTESSHMKHVSYAKSLLETCQEEDKRYAKAPHSDTIAKYKCSPMLTKKDNPNALLHELYIRASSEINERYLMFLEMTEQQLQYGDDDQQEYETSMVEGSCWTPAEKTAFFLALERCGRRNIVEISRRVRTKTVTEVASYIEFLDKAAKNIQGDIERDPNYAAREMSTLFIVQEEMMALELTRQLETEKFAKHRELLESDHQLVQKATELLEVWNISSLTRLFAKTNDMVVLSSTLVNMYELLKRFIRDILMSIHTELLASSDKTVDRKIMNHAIAKRQRLWTDVYGEKDRRLQDMDIMGMLEKYYKKHDQFSCSKSASYLAKRRRRAWATDVSSVKRQEEYESSSEYSTSEDETTSEEKTASEEETASEGEEEEEEGQDTEEDTDQDSNSDQDDMMQPFDTDDELQGHYYVNNTQKLHESEVKEEDTIDGVDADDEEEEISVKKEEKAMRRIDKQYEAKLMQVLGMYDKKALIPQ